MKTKLTLIKRAVLLALLSTINYPLSNLYAQGTAFTYQGQLQNNGSPASGTYNLTFSLFNTNTTGVAIAGPVTNNAVFVTNGLFTVLIDFGSGVFTGTNYWLDIGVETNGAGSFTTLTPRQQLTPTPYAIYAESVTASGIIGTLVDTQLTHSAVTVSPGPGLSGGGKVGLGNTIILTNTGVLSVTGNAEITAATVGGAVTLGDTATSADTASTLVKRDGSGNFSTATITLDGNLNLPATTPTAGIIYSGGVTMIHAYGSQNFFAGPSAGNLTMSGINSTANGYHALLFDTSGSDDTANQMIRIGNGQANTFIAGISGVTISPAGAAVFVNSAGELGTINSSRRFKEDIQNMGDQSDVLLALRPVAFRYKHELDPLGTPQFGLIAEEVEKVAPELVLRDDQGKIYSVRYEQINAMLLNEFLKQHSEFQKEHRTVEEQNTKLEELGEKVEAQNSENVELKQRLEALEKIALGQKSN